MSNDDFFVQFYCVVSEIAVDKMKQKRIELDFITIVNMLNKIIVVWRLQLIMKFILIV